MNAAPHNKPRWSITIAVVFAALLISLVAFRSAASALVMIAIVTAIAMLIRIRLSRSHRRSGS